MKQCLWQKVQTWNLALICLRTEILQVKINSYKCQNREDIQRAMSTVSATTISKYVMERWERWSGNVCVRWRNSRMVRNSLMWVACAATWGHDTVAAGVCVNVHGPCTTKGHADVPGLGCHLWACWCLKAAQSWFLPSSGQCNGWSPALVA